jgi:putative phosphonate metabolism protein
MTYDSGERYAIYWAPPEDSALGRIGRAWLGRDEATGRLLARPAVPGFADEMLEAVTAEPRRYGLHATLKPPFRLAANLTATALERDLGAFAAGSTRVSLPPLQLRRIGGFLALVPRASAAGLPALANACVERFDRFRAPAPAEELARRSTAGLTARQAANLQRWGYPYVMDDFRFHVTLTGRIERMTADRLMPELARLFAAAAEAPPDVADIALFLEPAPGAPLRLLRRFRLAG